MKLIFDHTKGFGKMRDKVIFYMPFGAFFDQSEYDEALNTGWFPANKDIWFQSRSTRINLSLYESNRTTEKIAKDIRYYPDVRMTPEKKARLEDIYKKYLAYKQYKNISFSIDDMIANSHGHIYYTYENKIIGFLFFKSYSLIDLPYNFLTFDIPLFVKLINIKNNKSYKYGLNRLY